MASPSYESSFLSDERCKSLVADRPFHKVNLHEPRSRTADADPIGTNVFFRNLIHMGAIQDMQAFFCPCQDVTESELLVFFELGDVGAGHSGIAHGGLIATLFDNLTGLGAHLALEFAGLFTVELDTKYKAAVKVSSTYAARVRIIREEGRRVWVRGSIETLSGESCAECRCLFVKAKKNSML